jgi:hypothetical protein
MRQLRTVAYFWACPQLPGEARLERAAIEETGERIGLGQLPQVLLAFDRGLHLVRLLDRASPRT